jgi:hypothetical protein
LHRVFMQRYPTISHQNQRKQGRDDHNSQQLNLKTA